MDRPVKTLPDPRSWAGYRRHSRARSTGALIVLVDGYVQGLASPGDGDGRWFLICDEHDTILSAIMQSELVPFMAAPEEWCDGCGNKVDKSATTELTTHHDHDAGTHPPRHLEDRMEA